ncbi:DUF2461 domain-containing protein [Arcticibacterium luteifluviistationis]|uniref:TIGR02453 family protein n=1 Tax=Arcticibacterium luteifluviistationis TaxID=1784714 RepID=A0A2Z4GFY3_9BACT|nr:DUF2461 domain-containing protein [Arcticibacterium luteifluviistationis]AWW00303.1 TIGR02453 family protein [Arcticibacterium luteifluviistationis]
MREVFAFLTALRENNNREWFSAHKARYEAALAEVIPVADKILFLMNQHDLIETPTGKKSLQRIYRDVRFSKNKTPYKSNWSGGFKRATVKRRGGYYFHLEPNGRSYLAGGFWQPNKDDIKLLREHFSEEGDEYRAVTMTKDFKKYFGEVRGEQLKKSPKGYDIEHPEIELLRYKQFLLIHPLTDEEVFASSFPEKASDVFQKMRPYFDLMSDFLTTDLNGIEINYEAKR